MNKRAQHHRCGRLDIHPPHEWKGPRCFGIYEPTVYWCAGYVKVEGGWWR